MSKDSLPPEEPPIAVVTGASQGLGRALALALADRGVTVAALARDAQALAEVAAAGTTGRIHPFATDVGDAAATARTFAEIERDLGAPKILINNAGVYPHRDILDETPDSFFHTVGINLGGAVNCCHAVLPAMVDRGSGRILNVGSFADLRPAPMSAAYSVSKGALRILTRALVADLGDRFPGIVINDWLPGVLDTRMGRPDGIDPGRAAEWGARLALMNDRNLNGLVFLEDHEHREPKSMKGRLKDRILRTGRAPVRLD